MADHEDPEFVMSQVKLAATFKAAGDLRQAISWLEQTLADSQRVLGTDHVATAAVRSDLAAAYPAAGELQRAVPLLEQAVADAERTLGDEHPVTLVFRNNLAAAYQDTGYLREVGETRAAREVDEDALARLRRFLGPDHPRHLDHAKQPRQGPEPPGHVSSRPGTG